MQFRRQLFQAWDQGNATAAELKHAWAHSNATDAQLAQAWEQGNATASELELAWASCNSTANELNHAWEQGNATAAELQQAWARGNGTARPSLASAGSQQVEAWRQPAAAAAGIEADPSEQAAAPLAGTHVSSPAAGAAVPPAGNISSVDWLRHRSQVRAACQLDSSLAQKVARSVRLLMPHIAKHSTAHLQRQWRRMALSACCLVCSAGVCALHPHLLHRRRLEGRADACECALMPWQCRQCLGAAGCAALLSHAVQAGTAGGS